MGVTNCYTKQGFNIIKKINDIKMMEEIKDSLKYAMQVKVCATGNYVMAEIQETQLEVKAQVIFNIIKKYGR